MRIVVTDGNERAALAITRSLGRVGHCVTVCSSKPKSLAGASRHAYEDEQLPDPLQDPEAFRAALEGMCHSRSAEVLLPVTDASLEATLPYRERFRPTRIPFPSAERYRAISDKQQVMERARALGIPTPAQASLLEPTPPEERTPLPQFPLVIKPSRSVIEDAEGKRKVGVSHVIDGHDLEAALELYSREAYPLLLQEYIPGSGEGGFFLRHEGQLVAQFAHRRIREKPPSGGISVYREAIPLASDVAEHSAALLEDFDWEGVAMVEFRRSSRDGRPYLMEVNARFWGSLQLALDAGVDFPRILVELDSGYPSEPVQSYRTGVRSRWWLGDLDHLLLRLRDGSDATGLPPGSPGHIGAVLRFLVPWRPGDRSEVLRWSDPGPGLREFAQWIDQLAHGRARP